MNPDQKMVRIRSSLDELRNHCFKFVTSGGNDVEIDRRKMYGKGGMIILYPIHKKEFQKAKQKIIPQPPPFVLSSAQYASQFHKYQSPHHDNNVKILNGQKVYPFTCPYLTTWRTLYQNMEHL